MIAKGQTKTAQEKRVSLGCCPVHGLFMSQETPYLSTNEAAKFGFSGSEQSVCLVRCSRTKCRIYALARAPEQIVRVLEPSEVPMAEEIALKKMKKHHTFLHLVRAELRAGHKKDLTPDEWEECYQLSRRELS